MKNLIVKKKITKTVPDTQWKTEYEVGEVIKYNPYLEGYIKAFNYYKWQVITLDEVKNNPDMFEEVKE